MLWEISENIECDVTQANQARAVEFILLSRINAEDSIRRAPHREGKGVLLLPSEPQVRAGIDCY